MAPSGFFISEASGAYSLLLDSIDVKSAGKSGVRSVMFETLLGCLLVCEMNGYCCGTCTPPGTDGGAKLKFECCCGVFCDEVE